MNSTPPIGNILLADYFEMDASYSYSRPRGMADWLITYTIDGEGYFIVDGRKEICTSGEVTLMRPGVSHQYGTSESGYWNFMWAHFSSAVLETSFLPDEALWVHSISSTSTQNRILQAFKRIIQDSRERGPYWQPLCLTALREILLVILQRRKKELDPRIEEALRYLSEHMRADLSIQDIAQTVNLSPSRLSHLFKEQTGRSMIDTLNRMRLEQAALLLQHTERTASQVAFDVGFNNYNHFASLFKKNYGMSPRRYGK